MAGVSSPPLDVMQAAFEAHRDERKKFTRRMAITIGDHFGMTPWEVVRYYERAGILKRGSVEWFSRNGGFRKDHFAEVRADRMAPA